MPEPTPSWAEFIAAFELYRDPILCAAIAGLVLGMLGVYVVLRRMVFVPLVITHSASFGVAIAYYVQIHVAADAASRGGFSRLIFGIFGDPVISAFIAGLLATALLVIDTERFKTTREAFIGLVYFVSAAGAILIGARITQEAHEIDSLIFGTAVAVDPKDLYAVAVVGAIVLFSQIWLRRGVVYASFDAEGAKVQKLPVSAIETFLLVSIGLMISVATRALGALPVFAFTILPAITALAIVRRIQSALILSAAVGVLCGVGGYTIAFFWQMPVGATQSGLAAALALFAMLYGRLRAGKAPAN